LPNFIKHNASSICQQGRYRSHPIGTYRYSSTNLKLTS
jgi:hypothetical protein